MPATAQALSTPRGSDDTRVSAVQRCAAATLAAAMLAGTMTLAAPPLSAEVVWENGQPVYRSDRRARPGAYDTAPFGLGFPFETIRPARPSVVSGGARPAIAGSAPARVAMANSEAPGTIIIDTAARQLYFVLSETEAYRYPIAVGKEGFEWTGTEQISRVADWPDWHPPAEMRARDPRLPIKMTGGLRNPLGAKAIYLGQSLYRIHGTNDASSIGSASSSGCFRMRNEHVAHLASIVAIGATVKVVGALPPPLPQANPSRSASAAAPPALAPTNAAPPAPVEIKRGASEGADTPATPPRPRLIRIGTN
ncbi:MAG: L,D-transpeptidase [Hyphomicrobiaceae bacterium]|nr:L,D-transpeptidase [Hyphomicrobiaceae bacterium]